MQARNRTMMRPENQTKTGLMTRNRSRGPDPAGEKEGDTRTVLSPVSSHADTRGASGCLARHFILRREE